MAASCTAVEPHAELHAQPLMDAVSNQQLVPVLSVASTPPAPQLLTYHPGCCCHACGPSVYTVTISRQPTCTCPDHQSGRAGGRCKHILFVMLRVLKLEQTNPLVWQRALLTQEVRRPAGQHKGTLARPLCLVAAPHAGRAVVSPSLFCMVAGRRCACGTRVQGVRHPAFACEDRVRFTQHLHGCTSFCSHLPTAPVSTLSAPPPPPPTNLTLARWRRCCRGSTARAWRTWQASWHQTACAPTTSGSQVRAWVHARLRERHAGMLQAGSPHANQRNIVPALHGCHGRLQSLHPRHRNTSCAAGCSMSCLWRAISCAWRPLA